jgi:hypothetical protein
MLVMAWCLAWKRKAAHPARDAAFVDTKSVWQVFRLQFSLIFMRQQWTPTGQSLYQQINIIILPKGFEKCQNLPQE